MTSQLERFSTLSEQYRVQDDQSESPPLDLLTGIAGVLVLAVMGPREWLRELRQARQARADAWRMQPGVATADDQAVQLLLEAEGAIKGCLRVLGPIAGLAGLVVWRRRRRRAGR